MTDYDEEKPGAWLPGVLALFFLSCPPVEAKTSFIASDIPRSCQQPLIADLDGDGLQDLVLMDETNLSVFYQDAEHRFSREPQFVYHLDPRPCLVWTAKLGGPAESLLVMTSDGVNVICLTNRTGPAAVEEIIRQATLLPAAAGKGDQMSAAYLPMSAKTDNAWPLLLLPVPEGIQVWQHGSGWQRAQTIGQAVAAGLKPSPNDSGYKMFQEFDLSVGDVNGDGREDLMIRQNRGWTNTCSLYLQQTNGLLGSEPAMVHADRVDPFSWSYWADFNRDGQVDLLKSVWLNEPSFIPGVPSGKVVAGLYLADERGRIATAPRQVFRKSDWSAPLPVVDVDGDGYLDLALGFRHLDNKESIAKMITDKETDYVLRFYFYRPGTGYPNEADFQRDVTIQLDRDDLQLGWDLPGDLAPYVKVGGDFGGDGRADLLARERSDEITAYFFISREKGFSLEPDLRFQCPEPVADWQVADLNHDGVSDLIVKLANKKGYRIFVSHR